MSLANVVVKLFVDMFIFIYAGGHLGFRDFGHFLGLEKNANPFCLDLHYSQSQNEDKMHESVDTIV